jgi:D-beta-D-heptose 7-phosphate kinase / D-beta-D-heptose 1-phosphate adenosyltransferase
VRVGFTCGCYDGLHVGHRHLLREASRQCDYLIVAVNDDLWCRKWKGPDRPLQALPVRIEAISNYLQHLPGFGRYNHSVLPFAGRDWDLIPAINPDVVFRGYDQGGIATGVPSQLIRFDKVESSTTMVAHEKPAR